MVIQPNMSPNEIIEVWDTTKEVFEKNNVPFSTTPINKLVDGENLPFLLQELNHTIKSSSATCIGGG